MLYEPTSPKKPKSIPRPQPSHVPGEATSPPPSEWTSVRISPGEDAAGQDLLAVRVLVTSEDSSSDTESDWENSKEPSAKRPPQPESPLPPTPVTRHVSLREPLTRTVSPQCPEEPRAAHGLQRSNSFQSSTPSKYQNWRQTFQSNLMPTDKRSPKAPSPLQSSSWSSLASSLPLSSSATVSRHTPEDSSPPQVIAHNPQSQASRGHCGPTPIYLRRAKAQGAPTEIPLYLPHGPVLERAEYCLVSPGADSLKSPAEVASDGCKGAEAPPGGTKSTHQNPYPIRKKEKGLPDQKLSLGAGAKPSEGNNRPRRGREGGSEPSQESKSGMKKLVLTPEQKTMLLDWNDSNSESVGLQAAEHIPREGGGGERGWALKPTHPLTLPQAGKEALPCQPEAQDQMSTPAVRAPGERSTPPPKSPLRLIANAIRRSLFPSGDAGKKAWAKAESKTWSSSSQPQACTRSLSLRKASSSRDGDTQPPGKHMARRASAFFSLGSPTARNAHSTDLSPPDTTLRTHSLPNRPPKTSPAPTTLPCSKLEDVPKLLEKVSLQDTLPGAARIPKARSPFFSSLRIKDKSLESFLQESRRRKDVGDLLRGPQGKGTPGDSVSSLETLAPPLRTTYLGQAAHLPSVAGDASSQRTPVGAQVIEAASSPSSTTSSSADEELDPQLSSRLKEKKTLQRRKKVERATRQLVKQEELKRLHKAQAIQRQLEEVEERQRASEIQGVRLEKALRGEADSGTQDEAQLLQEWFKLVLEKNKLMRYESELLIMAQELELEDHQSRLEQKLREKMLKEESQKDEKDKNEEQEIFNKMMQVIEQRDRLVDSLEEQRIKEKAEDQHFESFVFSRGCLLSRT